MSDHLQEAREFVECAENFSSPDDRSIPFVLHGILHALIAIAERMPQPLTVEEYSEMVRVQSVAAAAANAEALAGKWSSLRFDMDEQGMRISESVPEGDHHETITRDATDAPVTLAAPDAINPPLDPSAAVTEPHNTEGA